MASYCSTSDVAALAPMLVRGGSDFTSSTSPTVEQVREFIRWVAADMHTLIYSRGYSGSAEPTATAYPVFTMVNALGAAALAEITRTMQTYRAEDRQRGVQLWRMYQDQMQLLLNSDLSQAGFSVDNVPPYAGGTEKADKEQDALNSLLVQPRFFRGQFRHPEVEIQETDV